MRKIRSIFRKIAVAEAAALILALMCPVGAYAEPLLQIVSGGEYDIQYGDITVTAKANGEQEVKYSDSTAPNPKTATVTGIPVIKGTSLIHTVLLKTEGNNEAHVIFKGLNIDVQNQNQDKAAVSADCAAVIELDGENRLKSGRGNAGIVHTGNDGSTLTIQDGAASGMGELTVTGGSYIINDGNFHNDDKTKGGGAGIGGGFGQKGSHIVIDGAKIKAEGGGLRIDRDNDDGPWRGGGAGIGGGYEGEGSDITIKGGDVTAYGKTGFDDKYGGAGIGGGTSGSGSNIKIIDQAKVSANGAPEGAGIGGGCAGEGKDITIEGGRDVTAIGGSGGAGIGGGNENRGSEITLTDSSVTADGGIGGAGIGAGAGAGNYSNTEFITITNSTVSACGGYRGAGIGGGSNPGNSYCDTQNIRINSGKIYARGGNGGAGIGSGFSGRCERLFIKGGNIKAYGGECGAGIGSGEGSPDDPSSFDIYAKDIEITGGNVYAEGGPGAAGIGGGFSYDHDMQHAGNTGNGIRIGGECEVTAIGGDDGYSRQVNGAGGAGIGGGCNGGGTDIRINGTCKVNATGRAGGAGIGGGFEGDGADINIEGSGNVTARGGDGGAGIGGGKHTSQFGGNGKNISIGGSSTVNAVGEGGGAGIGGGNDAPGENIVIGGSCEVTAEGGIDGGVGIGGGYHEIGDLIFIGERSKVTASAGTGAAGIGAGAEMDGWEGDRESKNREHLEISGNAAVRVSGGSGEEGGFKPGAAIGYGSTLTGEGEEYSPYPKELTKDRIEFYKPGTRTAEMKASDASKRIKTPYTVYFRPDKTPTGTDVTPVPMHKTVISENTYGELPELNSADATFAGWYSAEGAGGRRVKADTTVKLTKNQILYGLWKVDYFIRYDANGGTGEMEQDNRTTGVEKKLRKNSFKKAHHLFCGWNTEADGSGESYCDEEIVDLAMRQNETATLYAQWDEFKIAPDSLPKGKADKFYEAALSIINNIPDVLWNWSIKGVLPEGLSLKNNADNTGTISGTPEKAGSFPITVVASANGESVEKDYTIEIEEKDKEEEEPVIASSNGEDKRLRKTIVLNGLDPKTGNQTDVTLFGPWEPVTFNGRDHVLKGTVLTKKKQKKMSADLDLEVTGLPGTVSISYKFKKTKEASDGKACYYIKLKEDKTSASYNALTKPERRSLRKAVRKANKILKKKENRLYFPVEKLDISGFVYDKEKSRKNYYVFTGNGTDTLILEKKTGNHTETISVEPPLYYKSRKSRMVLYAFLSGSRAEIPGKDYSKTINADSVTITGRNRNLTGTAGGQ